jgi:hypothetical protein
MAQAWAAGIGALLLIVAASGALVQTDLAVSRHHDGGGCIGVAFGGGCVCFRQAHRSFRGKNESGQQGHRQNTQHKTHNGISLFRSFAVHMSAFDPRRTWDLVFSAVCSLSFRKRTSTLWASGSDEPLRFLFRRQSSVGRKLVNDIGQLLAKLT